MNKLQKLQKKLKKLEKQFSRNSKAKITNARIFKQAISVTNQIKFLTKE